MVEKTRFTSSSPELESAVRGMTLSEFFSERFMEDVLARAPILNAQKAEFRKHRPNFEKVLGNRPSQLRTDNTVGEMIDRIDGTSMWWETGIGQSYSAHVLKQYVVLVMRGGAYSPNAEKVLELL